MIASIKYNEPGGKKIKTPDSLKMQLKRLATDNRIYRITVVIKNQYNSLFLVPNKQKIALQLQGRNRRTVCHLISIPSG